jgi:hypothetical protein
MFNRIDACPREIEATKSLSEVIKVNATGRID